MGGGYRFPEPALLVSVQSAETRTRYLANWLVLRPLWLGVIAQRPKVPSPVPKHWRAFLNSRPHDLRATSSASTTRTLQTQQTALEFFGDLLPEITQGASWAMDDTVSFRGTTIKIEASKELPPSLVLDFAPQPQLHLQDIMSTQNIGITG